MANAPFDRTIIHPREKPLSQDINQAVSQLDRTIRTILSAVFSDFDTGDLIDGFVQQGFKVVSQSPAAMGVTLKSGIGFQNLTNEVASNIENISGLDDLSPYKPLVLLNDASLVVPTAPTTPNTRIDIIEVRADLLTTEPSDRRVLNQTSGVFEPATLKKILSFVLDNHIDTINAPNNSIQPVSYKVGIEGNPGVVPATTSGYIKIAEIAVGSDVTSIVDTDITDKRPKLSAQSGSGEKIIPLHAASFIPWAVADYYGDNSADKDLNNDLGHVSAGASALSVMYPLELLVGTKVTGALAYFHYTSGSGSSDLSILKEAKASGGAGGTVIAGPVSRTTTGEVELSGLDITIERDFMYWINVSLPSGSSIAFQYGELRYKDR